MYGISKCHHIIHLNLPNNQIVCIEGLKDMPNLAFFNLSVNNLKAIQNLQFSTNLTHLDLSRNNITALADISCLTKLQTFHLNGNKISSLTRASTYLPSSICILSLADNLISDLNEVSNLVKLECLEQLTIAGNPCLLAEESSLSSFDYRPFVINWCLGLRLLDGHVASQKESLKAEWIYSQGKGRHFKPGEHAELIEYLSQVCPITADQSAEDEDEKLLRILHKQRQHKEQFLNEMSQSQIIHSEASNIAKLQNKNSMTQSYHFKTETSIKGPETEVSENINIIPSKIMYESAPEVLFHSSPPDMAQSCHPSFQSGRYPRSVSKSEILHNSVKSPITIEQVELDASPKSKAQEATKSPYQHYEDRRVRPSSSNEARPTHTPKGTLIRKVSKRAPSPSSATPPGCRSRLPHSTSKSRISPSRSCILTARLTAAAKNSSESDTSEELSQANRTPQRHFRSLSSDTQSGSNSPLLHQKYSTTTVSPTKRSFLLESNTEHALNSSNITNTGVSCYSPRIEKPKTLFDVYGKNEEDLIKAATKIQSVWRGYFVRHHNPRVFKMLQEVRFRRLEDHIQHLHGHLCRLTDFVLRQQQDLQHERELRKMQAEDIRHLHEKAKDLQRSVSVVVSKAKTNVFQNLSEHDPSNRDSPRDGSVTSESKFEKQLSTPSTESLNLALRYSTQMYQENSGLYSPSSQTSSVTSSIPDTYGRQKSRRDLPPSASDISDADSGLQSMVSPNVATTDSERHVSSTENDHATVNGFGHEVNSYLCKKDVLECLKKSSNKAIGNYFEKESPYDDSPTFNSKLGMHQAKAFRHSAPLATISSSGDAHLIHANHTPNLFKMPLKNTFVEYPLSSVENSPSSVFPPLPPDNPMNPLMRTNSDSFVLSRQQRVHSNLVSPSCLPISKRRSIDTSSESLADSAAAKNVTCSETAQGCCSKSCIVHHKAHAAHLRNMRSSAQQHACKHIGKTESDNSCSAKRCPLIPKNINHLAQNKVSSPLDETESPSSPCTVEMSGCISHSCSFQSDGYAAEEVSATATVKLFSSRAVSMTCTNGTLSPQASTQRPLSLSDASPQANLRSPLVLAASVWEKKVQDIESTFHQLQTQIRDLEGAFGQIGQFGQFFYPGILQDDPKELRPAINCAEPTSAALALDMPKINFKCSENCNPDKLFQTRLSGAVSSLPLTSTHFQNGTNQNCNDCRVEELDQPAIEETSKLSPNDSSENKE
nr:centrosomal protein of 97 kDa isoform X2 [Parasteatoda tepidariorum]